MKHFKEFKWCKKCELKVVSIAQHWDDSSEGMVEFKKEDE